MNKSALVAAFFLGCLVTGWGWQSTNPVAAQRSTVPTRLPAAEGDLVALSAALEGGGQQVILIDPKLRVLAVYHVDRGTGEIALKSVRNARHDLQIDHFNAAAPLPSEVRALIEQK